MRLAPRTAEQAFAAIVDALGGRPGVSIPEPAAFREPRFGSSALRVNGKIFAMVSHGRLVLKMPARRVTELIGSGHGEAYDAGKGRPMREWVSMDPTRQDRWLELATESLEFVGSRA